MNDDTPLNDAPMFVSAKASQLRHLPQGKPEKSKVVLAVGGKSALYYLSLTIAERKGFFKEAGLDVEINDFQGGAKSLQALMGGSAAGAAGGQPARSAGGVAARARTGRSGGLADRAGAGPAGCTAGSRAGADRGVAGARPAGRVARRGAKQLRVRGRIDCAGRFR